MSAGALPLDDARVTVAPSADRRAALALSLVDGVGPVAYRTLAARDGSAEAAFRQRFPRDVRERALRAADEALAAAARSGMTVLLLGDDGYPAALLDLHDPPPLLWCLGDVGLLDAAMERAAIVGTRAATSYGTRAATVVARALADADVIVVSGMARGIDGAAHAAALDAGAPTIAVLGTGADVVYPRTHRALHARIVRAGLVVSELAPGSAPSGGAFPRRNRIIAALARATIVVEAGARSGALITAGAALDLGRDVGAVPGPFDAVECAGSNALLRDGAAVIAEPDDALALVGVRGSARLTTATSPVTAPAALGNDARLVWDALSNAADVDTLAARVALPIARCLSAVTELELAGCIQTDFSGELRRRG